MNPYQISDEAAAKIISKIKKNFRHNRLAYFDEMNVLQTKKHVEKLYDRCYKDTLKDFKAALPGIVSYILSVARDYGFDGEVSELQDNFIEHIFEEYNPVTKYVYNSEFDRKQARLFEAIVALPIGTEQSYKTAENLLERQIKEYGVLIEDKVSKEIYSELGVEYVRWVTEKDGKVCHICKDLSDTVYKIDEAPEKAHINCRCYLVPVKKER